VNNWRTVKRVIYRYAIIAIKYVSYFITFSFLSTLVQQAIRLSNYLVVAENGTLGGRCHKESKTRNSRIVWTQTGLKNPSTVGYVGHYC